MKNRDPAGADDRAAQLLRQGAYAEAAAELRRIGELRRAQELYERIWDFRSAAEVARERGDRPALLRLLLDARDSGEVHLLHRQLLLAPPGEKEVAAQIYEQRRLWVEAAELREALGDLDGARVLYQRARRLLDVGRLCERLGALRDAGLAYEQITGADGPAEERARAHLGLGRVLRRFGRHEDAVRQLQRARRLTGDAALREAVDRTLGDSFRALGYGAVALRVEARLQGRVRPTGEEPAAGADPELLLGRYRIGRLLGSGGMGRVFLALDTLRGREVAIKVVPPPQAQSEAGYRRFLREARTAGALRHPHIVEVHDCHEAEGLLVMEYMAGGTVADRPLPLPGALARRLLLQVVDALGAAHACGLVHRDLKPHNIFLTATAEAKLGDFGVAHLLDLQATQTAGFVGTLAYMAPEQIAGGPIGFATDVYALGVTAFQLCTGRLPFPGPDFVAQHLGDEPPRPSDLRPGLDPAWDSLCLRALAKRPDERFASLDELRAAVLALPREGAASATPTAEAPAAPAPTGRDDLYRVEALLQETGHSRLLLGTDTRLGRPVLVEEFSPGLLQGELGAPQLRWLRLMARCGGPGLQRVLRIDLAPPAARIIYEAPLGALLAAGERLGAAEAGVLRRALRRIHSEGGAHGAVAGAVVREEAQPVLLVAGRGPLAGSGGAGPEDDLRALAALAAQEQAREEQLRQ